MSLSEEQRQVAIQLLVEKSDRNLQQAVVNAEFGYWDLVANRLYYSIFHIVTALLMKDGIKVQTHKGTSSQFGRYYVLTGKFDREDGSLYSRLQTMREKADYQNVFNLNSVDGEKLLAQTRILQEKIKATLY